MTNFILTVRLLGAPNGELSSVMFVVLIFELFFCKKKNTSYLPRLSYV